MLEDLEAQGLLEKVEDHTNNVGRCYRCDTVIEPYLSDQWFVKMKPLAEPALQVVEERDNQVLPGPLGESVPALDDQHPRLVHLAPALVGTPHPGLVLRRQRPRP